jgi:hypothetical protein
MRSENGYVKYNIASYRVNDTNCQLGARAPGIHARVS